MTGHNYKSSAWTARVNRNFPSVPWQRLNQRALSKHVTRGHRGYRNKFRSAWPAYLGFCLKHSLIPRSSWEHTLLRSERTHSAQEKWFSMASFLARPLRLEYPFASKINAKTSPCTLDLCVQKCTIGRCASAIYFYAIELRAAYKSLATRNTHVLWYVELRGITKADSECYISNITNKIKHKTKRL